MHKKKILFIDDEPDLVEPTKFLLEDAGYEVHTANDGQEGLSRFEEIRPDLVILDIMMPRLNGIETLYMLRNSVSGGRDVPVIMFTVKQDKETVFEAKGYGATEYMVKTADSEELLDKVKTLLLDSKS